MRARLVYPYVCVCVVTWPRVARNTYTLFLPVFTLTHTHIMLFISVRNDVRCASRHPLLARASANDVKQDVSVN